MSERISRYQRMEWLMTYALVADAGLFVLYLIFAAFGVTWLKVILAILVILISLACLAFLFMSKELLKQRSLWMSAASAAVLICLIFSLLLNFPRPNPYKTELPAESKSSSESVD